jgi:hypothetical protein
MALNLRREAARAFFEAMERGLGSDEVLADKQCVALILDKAQRDHAAETRKRFDSEGAFRNKLLFPKIDEIVTDGAGAGKSRPIPTKSSATSAPSAARRNTKWELARRSIPPTASSIGWWRPPRRSAIAAPNS